MADREILEGTVPTLKACHTARDNVLTSRSLANLRAAPLPLTHRQHTNASAVGFYQIHTPFFYISNPIMSYLRYTCIDSACVANRSDVGKHILRIHCSLESSLFILQHATSYHSTSRELSRLYRGPIVLDIKLDSYTRKEGN